jgi:hypothetical protein
MLDSYENFLSEFKISENRFLDFGIKSVIYIPADKAKENWDSLKNKISNDEEVFVRGFGRDAKGTPLLLEFYKHLLGNSHIKKDLNNNIQPTKMIKELSGYSKTENTKYELISNYQISHIYGRTKNVYAFTAPWNIAYIPKIYDPFTGHEANGDMVKEFTSRLKSQTYKKFKPLIEDFNNIVNQSVFKDKLKKSLDFLNNDNKNFTQKQLNKLKESIESEFSPINF